MSLSEDALREIIEEFGPSPGPPPFDARQPEFGVRPKGAAELSSLLTRLHNSRVEAIVSGSGSRREWGNPLRGGRVVIATEGLDGIRELDPEEGVVCAGAGTPIATLTRAAADAGWAFPLDPPGGASTLGGVLAADAFGPRHRAYGRARDVVLGIEVCLGDGTPTRSGGRVVKNVTGYDLAKLHIGALGTLGVVTEAWIKLKAAPEWVQVLSGAAPEPKAALEASRLPGVRALAVLDAELAAAVEPGREIGARVVVELADRGDVVEHSERRLVEGFGLTRSDAGLLDRVRALQGSRPEPEGLRFRIAALPTRLAAAAEGLSEAGAAWLAYPESGLLYARFRPLVAGGREAPGVAEIWSRVREVARAAGGQARLEAGPLEARRVRDVFGDAPEGDTIFRELKSRFDPAGILNPGRFAGGI